MDEWSSLTIESTCRVCTVQSVDLQPIFTSVVLANEESSMHLSEMIASFSRVQITLGDGLPEKICNTCAEDTVNFYLFKQKCEDSDKFLREKLIGKIVDVKEEVAIDREKHENNKASKSESCLDNFLDFSDNPDDDDSYSVPSPQEESAEPTQKTPEKTKDFACNICERQFSREDLLVRHKIAHIKKLDSLERCFEEDMQGSDTEDVTLFEKNNHILVKQDQIEVTEEYDTIYPCPLCDYIYLQPDDLTEHQQIHQPILVQNDTAVIEVTKPQNQEEICEICNKKMKKETLKRHLRAHKALRNFICDKCGKGFMRRENLQSHIKSHEGVRPHSCQICFKGFNQISNLKDHMRTHNGEKPFLCSTCGKGFNQLGNLRQHTVRHSGVKAHTCPTCGYAFASKGELGAHLRKHTGVRPFVCEVCNTGFTTSSSLVKHKRIHSGEKPYECDVCHLRFSRSGILARHKRTHTGEKPYICSFCQKAFTQSNDLNSHMRIHTGERPFICDECGQAFRQNSALKTHKKTHKKRVMKLADLKEKISMGAALKKYEVKCDVVKLPQGQKVFLETVPQHFKHFELPAFEK